MPFEKLEAFADTPDRRFGEQATALRRRLGIEEHEAVLLYAGAFLPEKRAAVLLDQFLEFRRHAAANHWHLILAGDGVEKSLLQTMSAGTEHIHFLPLPKANELPILYRAADLVALVSWEEPGTETVAGAMRCARAVLVTEGIRCAAALVEPNQSGWSLDSAHPELWFDYPKAASKKRLKAMGEAAERRIQQHARKESAYFSV